MNRLWANTESSGRKYFGSTDYIQRFLNLKTEGWAVGIMSEELDRLRRTAHMIQPFTAQDRLRAIEAMEARRWECKLQGDWDGYCDESVHYDSSLL